MVSHDASFGYAYTTGLHRFGLEPVFNDRDPDTGASSTGYRVGVSYTWSFDRPASRAAGGSSRFAPAPQTGVPDRARITTGRPLEDVVTELAGGGVRGGIRLPVAVVWEVRYFADIDLRQRLVVEHRNARVREALIRRLGPPAATCAEGRFGPDLTADLDADRFVRIDAWRNPARGLLRFGIPRRLDGVDRLEFQSTGRLLPSGQSRWSVESVR